MDNAQTYKIWAPDDGLWTAWAKPVLFATGDFFFVDPSLVDIPQIGWLPERCYNTMIIVDLPGKQSVEEGLALARFGYRPVPLYNGVNKPNKLSGHSIVDVAGIVTALFAGAEVLRALSIAPAAPPAFLLDSNRMTGGVIRSPGWYDNRWCVFPQDMPSAAFLAKRRIQEVIVRSYRIQDDLAHILYRYQEQKIKVSLCDGSEIKMKAVLKPRWFKSLLYRFKVILGLTRNPVGGFGGLVPHSSGGG